jgi:hypothetical protein
MLISRPAGKEAAAIMLSSFKPKTKEELIELDFTDVQVIAPSWLDEVLTSLKEAYGERFVCLASDNLSLIESLKVLQKT